MSARVSVIMPAYNHARFVSEAVQSVLDQSYRDLDLIITDDGSTDGTSDAIAAFDDARIDLQVFEQNRGAVVAENACISRSTGEFIALLNSDDFFLPGKIATQVAYLERHPDIAAVFGLPKRIDERGKPIAGLGEFTLPLGPTKQSRNDWLRVFFFHNCLCHPTVMIRRSVFDRCGVYDPRLASIPDLDMWVRLVLQHDIVVLQQELTAFRILDGGRNASASNPARMQRVNFEMFEVLKHFRQLPAEEVRLIFAPEIKRFGIKPTLAAKPLLAEIAARGPTPAHQLFALDTLFEAHKSEQIDFLRLQRLAESLRPFR